MFRKFIKKIINKIRRKKVKGPVSHYGTRLIYTGSAAQDLLIKELSSDKPSMICRFGSTELSAARHWLKNIDKGIVNFPELIKKEMSFNSGFFPATDYNLSRFASEFIDLVKNIDIIGVWFQPAEEEVLEQFGKQAKLIFLEDLNVKCINHGYYRSVGAEPADKLFSSCLAHKKVLVIHPFVETIKSQYQKRELLFDDKDTLPEFELITLKAVQSIANSKDLPYSD